MRTAAEERSETWVPGHVHALDQFYCLTGQARVILEQVLVNTKLAPGEPFFSCRILVLRRARWRALPLRLAPGRSWSIRCSASLARA